MSHKDRVNVVLKGIVHAKINKGIVHQKNLNSHPHVALNLYDFLSSVKQRRSKENVGDHILPMCGQKKILKYLSL